MESKNISTASFLKEIFEFCFNKADNEHKS